MTGWSAGQLAAVCGAELIRDRGGEAGGFAIDSRECGDRDLFIGIVGERVNGGRFADGVLESGAWGVLVTPDCAAGVTAADGAILAHPDPTAALGLLAGERRRELGCKVIAVTGSTGKTSTKDILGAILAPTVRTFTSHENRNTEIGMPLEILSAPADTEVMVLEEAMRGSGQIELLTGISDPDVGVIVNVGPVHLELLGSIEAIAAAKAELPGAMRPGTVAVVPADEPLLAPYRRTDQRTVTFGPGGDVRLLAEAGRRLTIAVGGEEIEVNVDFDQPHHRLNLLAAIAAAMALEVRPPSTISVGFSSMRGQRLELDDGIVVIDDCYNANPMSMRAALEDLASEAGRRGGRRVAVLGDMLELGPDQDRMHEEIGDVAEAAGVDLLITVGPLAASIADRFRGESICAADAAEGAAVAAAAVLPGDTVLVKASRGIGLETVTAELAKRS